eukprot:6915813-Prymnesium_polylepis.1
MQEQGDAAAELQVLAVAARARESRQQLRAGVGLLVGGVGAAAALLVLSLVMEVLEARVDHAPARRLDALEGREDRQVFGDLRPQHLVSLLRHRVDHDVPQMLPAVSSERLVLPLTLLVAHRVPLVVADVRLHRLHDHLDQQPPRAPGTVAGVRHEHRVLAQAVKPDVVRRRVARLRPAARPTGLLELGLPLVEAAARVRQDLALDVREDGGRRPALGQDGEAAEADVLDRAVGVLDLGVARDHAVAELGRLVPAEGHDAHGHRELVRRHGLTRDGELCPQQLHLPVGRARHVDPGGHRRQHVGDVH